MSNYFNADGEPLMTAATARFEAELDAMSADDFYDYMATAHPRVDEDYFYYHPEECQHEDGTYLGSGVPFAAEGDFRCDLCYEVVGRWVRAEDGWCERV